MCRLARQTLGLFLLSECLILSGGAAGGAVLPQTRPVDVAAVCAKYEAAMRRWVDAGEPARALLASAEYEQAISALTAAPVITAGTFRSDAYLLEFTVPF